MFSSYQAHFTTPLPRVRAYGDFHSESSIVHARSGSRLRSLVVFSCSADGSFRTYDRVEAAPRAQLTLDSGRRVPAEFTLVRAVPCDLHAYPESSGPYEMDGPGLVPDRLEPISEFGVRFLPGRWQAIHVQVQVPDDAPQGRASLSVEFVHPDAGAVASAQQDVTITAAGPLADSFHHHRMASPGLSGPRVRCRALL